MGEQLSRSHVAPTYSLLYGCEPITTFWDDLIGQKVRALICYMLLDTNAKCRIGYDHSLNAAVKTCAYIVAFAMDMHCT